MEIVGISRETGNSLTFVRLPDNDLTVQFSEDLEVQDVFQSPLSKIFDSLQNPSSSLLDRPRAQSISLASHFSLLHPDLLDQNMKTDLVGFLVHLNKLYPGVHPDENEVVKDLPYGMDVCPYGNLLEVDGMRGNTPTIYIIIPTPSVRSVMFFEDKILQEISEMQPREFCEEIEDLSDITAFQPDINEVYALLRDMQRFGTTEPWLDIVNSLVDSVADTIREMNG